MDQRMALITPQLTYDGFEQADIIVEAVFEGMALKKQIFAELDKIAKPDCILASNTSTLDIDEIASATRRPQMVIGHHLFQPGERDAAARNRAREGDQQGSDRDVDGAGEEAEQGRRAGRQLPRLHRQSHGPRAIGARRSSWWRKAPRWRQWTRRCTISAWRWGRWRWATWRGWTWAGAFARNSSTWKNRACGYRWWPTCSAKWAATGRRPARGWYAYDENRKPSPDPEVAALIEKTARGAGIEQRSISNEEIVERTYVRAGERRRADSREKASRCARSDIDIVYLNGYGFPAWRGGPMFYADTVGLKKVLAKIEEFEKRHGADLWAPAPLLKRLAERGATFADYDRENGADAA